MKQIQNFCERYGKWMFLFALMFTFGYSFFYSVEGSNPDYLYYMHLVDEGRYDKNAMIAGTILLSKPLWFMFGHKLWMWKVWAWTMACLTSVIPFYALLNKDQRNKYTYIIALVVLVLNIRTGLEPPKYVYLLNTIMLTFFVKYIQSNKFGWIVGVSTCVALITFARFPSLFAWPVVVIAMLILRKDWIHTISVISLPVIIFIGLVTLTNGGVIYYFENLTGNIGESSSGDHSLMKLLMGYVTTTTHAIAYMTFICLPLLMYGIWKRSEQTIFKTAFIISFFVIAVIIIVHPTDHLSCALTMATVILYGYCSHWNLKDLVLGGTIIVTNMFCSVGSDCGFVHEAYSVTFLPFLLVTLKSENSVEKKSPESWRSFKMSKVIPLYTSLVFMLLLSTFVHRCISVGTKYSSGIACGGELFENLSGLLLTNESMLKCSVIQKEYLNLKKSYGNVIYWGTFNNHLMSFVNNQWPVTDIWKIESKDKEKKPFSDFVEYVKRNKPVVIDLEKHSNTKTFMVSQGYVVKKRDFGNIYTIEK